KLINSPGKPALAIFSPLPESQGVMEHQKSAHPACMSLEFSSQLRISVKRIDKQQIRALDDNVERVGVLKAKLDTGIFGHALQALLGRGRIGVVTANPRGTPRQQGSRRFTAARGEFGDMLALRRQLLEPGQMLVDIRGQIAIELVELI